MPRARDLDTIAPDDLTVNPSTPASSSPPLSQPQFIKKKKHSKANHESRNSKDLEFRQKVYELIRGKTSHPLSSFLVRPKVFAFDGQNTDEEIILVLRRHWFTNLSWIFTAILMIFAPVFLRSVPLLSFFTVKYQFVFVLLWYLITFALAFEQFLSWYFNVFVITEERVIDIDFYNLLYKKYSEAEISVIQDVTSISGGVSQTVLNYGTVLIQTAAEIPVIKIERIPNPNLVVKILQQMRGEEKQEELDGRLK